MLRNLGEEDKLLLLVVRDEEGQVIVATIEEIGSTIDTKHTEVMAFIR